MLIHNKRPEGGIIVNEEKMPDLNDKKWRYIAWIPVTELKKLLEINFNLALEERIKALIDKYKPTVTDQGEEFEIPPEFVMKKLLEYKAEVRKGEEKVNEEFKELVINDLNALIEEASKTPIQDRKVIPYSFQAAHKDNPNSYSAQDLQHFEMNIKRKMAKLFENLYQRMWMWIIAIVATIGVSGVIIIAILKYVD